MDYFDLELLTFVNGYARESWLFDSVIVRITGLNLVKGGVVISILWWAWFRPESQHKRGEVLSTLFASLCAVLLARLLALGLPHRPRPIHDPEIPFRLPFTMTPEVL